MRLTGDINTAKSGRICHQPLTSVTTDCVSPQYSTKKLQMFFQRWLIPVAIIPPSEPFQVHVNVSFYRVTVPMVGFPVLMIIRPLSAVLWALGDGEITCSDIPLGSRSHSIAISQTRSHCLLFLHRSWKK